MAAWLGAENQLSTFPFSYQLKCKYLYFNSSQELWSLQLSSWRQDLATSCCCYSCHHGVRVWLWAVVVTAANRARVWLGTVVVIAVIMVSGCGYGLWSFQLPTVPGSGSELWSLQLSSWCQGLARDCGRVIYNI